MKLGPILGATGALVAVSFSRYRPAAIASLESVISFRARVKVNNRPAVTRHL